MNLMISENVSRIAPAATHADATVDILAYATGECALGQVLVAHSVEGVCAIAAEHSTSAAVTLMRILPRRDGIHPHLRG